MTEIQDIELKEKQEEADVQSTSSHKSSTTNDQNPVDGVASFGHSSNGSKFSMEESSDLEYMLKNEHLNRGILGPLESLPLWLKLTLMLLTSSIGVLILGSILMQSEAKEIRANRKINQSSGAYTASAALIDALQVERANAVLFLTKSVERIEFTLAQTDTNNAASLYLSTVRKDKKFSGIYSRGEREWLAIRDELANIRQQVSSSASVEAILDSYTELITQLSNFLTLIVNESSGNAVMSFNVLVRMKEVYSLTQAYMAVQLNALSISQVAVNRFIDYLGQAKSLRQMFEAVAPEQVLFNFYLAFPASNDSLVELQQQIIDDPTDTSIGAQAWYVVMGLRLEKLLSLQENLGQIIKQNSRDNLNRRTARITVIVVLIVFFWISSFASAILFAQTITGPWQRMMKTQENTIKKFVPKGFLRLVKCYRLADLTLGKSVQRDLTVMLADIRNFTAMSENMTPSQIFGYLNKYLAYVGPIIRRNGGYIDKFMGDGIMTCFPTMTNGIHTCLLMQDAIDQFNKENASGPQIKVGIGIHCGPVMVGAIGENERMEGTIISECVAIIGRLENLTKYFGAKILTTGEAMKRIKNPKSLHYRPLGYVHMKGKEKGLKVYEVVHKADKLKVDSVKKFKEGMDYMIKHDYEKAIPVFEQILSKNSADLAAQRVLNSCRVYQKELEESVAQLTIHDGLRIDFVRDAMGEYAPQEKQEGHFKCWVAVYEFSAKAPSCNDKERMQMIKNIMDQFLKSDAPLKVKSERNWHQQVETIIVDYHIRSASPDPHMFDDLAKECEENMSGAFGRFKRTDEFLSAYKCSRSLPYIQLTDLDTL